MYYVRLRLPLLASFSPFACPYWLPSPPPSSPSSFMNGNIGINGGLRYSYGYYVARNLYTGNFLNWCVNLMYCTNSDVAPVELVDPPSVLLFVPTTMYILHIVRILSVCLYMYICCFVVYIDTGY